MAKLVLISDTHLCHEDSRQPALEIPDGDILIHSGDATCMGRASEVYRFFNWFASHPHKHKIFVAGNHDVLFEKAGVLARSMVPQSVTYLEDNEVIVMGLRVYGSPWTPEFQNWAFNLPRGHRLRERWNRIPRDVDVLVSHGPPRGILDSTPEGEHVGCADLREIVGRVKPRLHVFGHIHHSGGRDHRTHSTLFVNASVCNEAYNVVNKPYVVELEARQYGSELPEAQDR